MFEEFGDSAAYVFGYWRRDTHGWGGPPGPSIAFRVAPEHVPGEARRVLEPYERPTLDGIHAWVSARCEGVLRDGKFLFDEPQWLRVDLREPVYVEAFDIYFNSDVERHLANVWYAHPAGERAMTTLVADAIVDARLPDGTWTELERITNNYRRRREMAVGRRINSLRVSCMATHGERYASIVDLRMR
jgi:hypothetical protein